MKNLYTFWTVYADLAFIKKYFTAIFFYLTFHSGILGQSAIEMCGVFPPHTATSTSLDSIYFDRFGNTYDKYTTPIVHHSPAVACNAGYFTLSFLNGVPTDMQNVFCKVFSDLSELIPL